MNIRTSPWWNLDSWPYICQSIRLIVAVGGWFQWSLNLSCFFLGGKFSDILLVSWLNLPKHDVSSYHMSCSHLTKCPMSPGNQSFSTVAMMKNAYHCWFMLIKKWIGNADCPLILIILILMNLHIKNFCINWITDIAVNIIGRSLAKRKDGRWNLSCEWTCKQVLESIWVRYFSLLRLFLSKKLFITLLI